MDMFSNIIWSLGVIIRNNLKRVGLLGPFESVLAYLGPRLIPPPSKEVTAALPFALKLAIPAGSPSARNFMLGLYEKDVTTLFLDIVKEGMTVIDVGASIGYYTLLASRLVGALGRVYALEPDPEAYGYLRRNVASNNCNNVVTMNMAIWDRSAEASFVRKDRERGFLSPHPVAVALATVETITLDELFAKVGCPRVDLIKLDIEGSETAALQSMQYLSRRNPHLQVIMEYDLANLHQCGTSPEALAAAIQSLGFQNGFIIERKQSFSVGRTIPVSQALHNLLLRKDQVS